MGFRQVVERVFAIIVLIVLAPILIVVGTLVFILSRQSPLVAHLRVGEEGRKFWLFKLRTMWARGSRQPTRRSFIEFIRSEPAGLVKPGDDPRVTSRFAAFCRKYSIDELPQLVNVLRGEMSLVGPRPLTEGELIEHYGAYAAEVLLVKPGITGLWQTMGRSRLTYEERRRLDVSLVRSRSPQLYLRILLRTIPRVLGGRDAW
jgi:lipopolysaccharide/colanic/teichoic acid biosynthesis glycosyltransferase